MLNCGVIVFAGFLIGCQQLDTRLPFYRDFMQKLARHSHSLGMKINQPCDMVFQPRGKAAGRFLEDLVSKYKGLQLIVVILPKKGADSGYGM